jgi:hypothetical protein
MQLSSIILNQKVSKLEIQKVLSCYFGLDFNHIFIISDYSELNEVKIEDYIIVQYFEFNDGFKTRIDLSTSKKELTSQDETNLVKYLSAHFKTTVLMDDWTQSDNMWMVHPNGEVDNVILNGKKLDVLEEFHIEKIIQKNLDITKKLKENS